ncbi:MAG: hypothetical protein ACLFUH_04605 [Bacteroidales bacterium]
MKKFIVLLVVIGLVVGGIFIYNKFYSFEAKVFSETREYVNINLRSPSTADYTMESIEEDQDKGTVTVEGYVDAQNAYGATVRTNFTATFSKEGILLQRLVIDGEVAFDAEEHGLDFDY